MIIARALALLLAVSLVAAVPRHVLTGDYWGGYAGTHKLPAPAAAKWLSWAEVSPQDSAVMAPLGVHTLLYTNPNREQPGDPMWSTQDAVFAHNCNGERVRGETKYAGQQLTDVHSPALAALWKRSVERHMEGAHYDAVFDDEAVGALYASEQPCNYSFDDWLRAQTALIGGLGYPVIYNGLNDFYNHGVAREIALNRTAAGGMMEECYAQLADDHRVAGWQWYATEVTEMQMAREHKIFVCYGRDLTPAEQAFDGRIYTYASFLLTYDPNTTMLWEYYKTPSGGHVMPESRLVALQPLLRISRVAQLRAPGGAYVREYRACYLDARPVGPCAAAVNPDDTDRGLSLRGYGRTLVLNGSGIFDGGTATIANRPPPSSLAPRGAIVAFK